VSNNIPLAMAPGEKLAVQAVMKNTGTASPANDWPFPSNYALNRTAGNAIWGWTYTRVASATAVNSDQTFKIILTAPATPGTYTFGAQMRLLGDSAFGQVLSVPGIVVSTATTPQWRCEFDQAGSDLPTNLAPGQSRTVTLKLNNTGLATWGATNFVLKSQDTRLASGVAEPPRPSIKRLPPAARRRFRLASRRLQPRASTRSIGRSPTFRRPASVPSPEAASTRTSRSVVRRR